MKGAHKSKIKNDIYYTTLGPRCKKTTKENQNQDSMKQNNVQKQVECAQFVLQETC
jgi:hypothetical protein